MYIGSQREVVRNIPHTRSRGVRLRVATWAVPAIQDTLGGTKQSRLIYIILINVVATVAVSTEKTIKKFSLLKSATGDSAGKFNFTYVFFILNL